MSQLDIFDFLDDGEKFKPIKSTDWKWTMANDYPFGKESVEYICGMSVPPIMIKRIVTRLIESGLFDYKLRK
jgi:hypothetical protein